MIFYFRLARELGYTIGRLLHEIQSIELTAWMAFAVAEKRIDDRKKQKASDNLLRTKMIEAGQLAAAKKKHG